MDVDMDKVPEYNVTDVNKTVIHEEQKVDYGEEYKKKLGKIESIHVEIRDGKRVAVVKTLTPDIAKILKDSKVKYDGICIKGFNDFYNGGEVEEILFTPKEFFECAKKIEELTADLKGNNEFTDKDKAVIMAGRVCQVVATDLVNEFKATELEKILAQPMKFYGKVTMEEANQKWKEQMQVVVQEANNDRDFVRANTTIGALIDGKATSQGYADLYKNIMDTLGIPCRVVSGKIKNVQMEEYEASYWNQIKLEDGKWGNINVFNIDNNERNQEKNDYLIENREKINKAKTIEEQMKILQKLTKIDSKEYVPDRHIDVITNFNNMYRCDSHFSPKLAGRQENLEYTYLDNDLSIESVISESMESREKISKIARYENLPKGSMGKEVKRLKLDRGKKYLVAPQNSPAELTDEEKATYKKWIINSFKYSQMPEEVKSKFIDFYDKHFDTIVNYENLSEPEKSEYHKKLKQELDEESLERYMSVLTNGKEGQNLDNAKGFGNPQKSNEFRDGLKVSEEQLIKNEDAAKENGAQKKSSQDKVSQNNNVSQEKDEELER